MPLWVGTSGWQYPDWHGAFYPEKLPQRLWLEHYAARFRTVEVNNTFYNLPDASVFEAWGERTPDDFLFVLKLSRYLTHIKRLRDPQAAVDLFLEHARPLQRKTGPLLLQLPPNFEIDLERLDAALRTIPAGMGCAVEFRHASWYVDETAALLREHGVPLCLTDRGSRLLQPLWRTADWGFVRLHEGRARPIPCYGSEALQAWVDRIATLWSGSEDVFVFFNNDPHCCAVRDAITFAQLAAAAGLQPTRVPQADEVRLSV